MFDHLDIPVNSLSLGQVSYNLMREIYRGGNCPAIFPVGEKADLQAYVPDKGFVEWMNECASKRLDKMKAG